ncbi:hypothetical protein THRCLA_02469 [Thraustotheca clavata]|uniref:Uncharacterized protein n=1 Tax=Thraustotheca clavata TaxID=74557 RepID=A0A1W0A564_9STRA|nr:hypothetical protein THRCLA_02469 [Thraustotheca clavata]
MVDELKRLYNRQKQREFRERLENKLSALRLKVSELETQLARQNPSNSLLLPWQEVASSLATLTATTVDENRLLRQQLEQLQRLYRVMQLWVHQPQAIHPANNSIQEQPSFTSKRISLHNDLDIRQMSCEWLMERLYQNSERLLEHHGLLRVDTLLEDIIIDVSDCGALEYYSRLRRVVDAPLRHVAKAYRLMGNNNQGDFILSKRTQLDLQALAEKGIVYSQATYKRNQQPWQDNRLWGIFENSSRFVIVSQNVHDDELNPLTPLQRFRYSIIVADRLSESKTLVREMVYSSQTFDAITYIPLELECMQFGIPLTAEMNDEQKLDAFMALLNRGNQECQACWKRMFNYALQLTS